MPQGLLLCLYLSTKSSKSAFAACANKGLPAYVQTQDQTETTLVTKVMFISMTLLQRYGITQREHGYLPLNQTIRNKPTPLMKWGLKGADFHTANNPRSSLTIMTWSSILLPDSLPREITPLLPAMDSKALLLLSCDNKISTTQLKINRIALVYKEECDLVVYQVIFNHPTIREAKLNT